MSGSTTVSWRRFVATVLLFAVIIPAIGITATIGFVAVVFGFGPQSIFSSSQTISVVTALGYVIGAIPAAGVGVAVAWRDRKGGASGAFAAGAGLIGGLVFALGLLVVGYDGSVLFFAVEIAALVIAVVGALIAWKVTRPFRRAGTGAGS